MKAPLMTLLGFVFVAGTAQARPSTLQMTCQQTKQMVSQSGRIVLSTGKYTYEMFVRHKGYCAVGEDASPAWVPTKDSRRCFIGYTCAVHEP